MAARCTLLLLLGSVLGVALSRGLICWHAILQCQRESDCSYAFSQYTEACSSVISRPGESSRHHRCPSHCISALIQLNSTKGGPALENCDCAVDDSCKATKRAIEPCMPWTSGARVGGGASAAGGGAIMGCTEARRLCDGDRRCQASVNRYMSKCGRLFNGVRCTDECRGVIEDMMQVPKALLLNDCVCDGPERAICETLKENMARLCFGAEPGSSGNSDYDEYEDEYDEEEEPHRVVTGDTNNGSPTLYANALTLGTSVALVLLLLG
ncbi:growth arrest-specific protein 1 [Rana temporaria]|uniref:growth arrest-specific protein 1 n=1 Tax=Rana temporaria TaxID=8407 RepID=UPI001AAC678F|nr:growth arrest-specific protein 1 [Rana temporaria]XP_040211430.1 growth arrest-specific protein 1 [Rana temporaria]XP_040211431.1 growth arrest-specific protein 1 [Rana temporaria]XP_040211432.1 growth arrest-specific protein 1 [Rana temporaria]XP_040211433.1 growth arrest-specific protein 1 [Rana temporaria]XP_040211434.1 growth arrest-specific protein 1 [Rana temporaria]